MAGRPRKNNFSHICPCCGKDRAVRDLWKSHDTIFHDGYAPICKLCANDIYKEALNKYELWFHKNNIQPEDNEIERLAVRKICMLNDMYYSDAVFNAALTIKDKNNTTMLSKYLRKVNIMHTKSYEDTILTELGENIEKENNYQKLLEENLQYKEELGDDIFDDANKTEDVSLDTIHFFGSGFKENDYRFLQEQYDDWTTRHECKTKAQEEVFKQICFTQLELQKATRAGVDTKDLTATFQKLLDTAKLQPKQNHSDAMSDAQTFGTLIDKWENTRPIPEVDEELKDVDKIGLYQDIFFRGHLAKMLGLKNAMSNLYQKFIQKYTVSKPEYDDDKDSEIIFDAVFGNQSSDGGD